MSWVRRLSLPVKFTALALAYLTAVHTVTHGIPRYRLPLEPFLIVLAGIGLDELVSRVNAWVFAFTGVTMPRSRPYTSCRRPDF